MSAIATWRGVKKSSNAPEEHSNNEGDYTGDNHQPLPWHEIPSFNVESAIRD